MGEISNTQGGNKVQHWKISMERENLRDIRVDVRLIMKWFKRQCSSSREVVMVWFRGDGHES